MARAARAKTTKTKAKSPRKPRTKAAPAAESAKSVRADVPSTDAVAATAAPGGAEQVVVSNPVVKPREFINRVAASTGMRPNKIKPVLQAVLNEMGDLLSAGETLNLQPLGKIRVNRRREGEKNEVLICKVTRRKHDGPPPLAEAAE